MRNRKAGVFFSTIIFAALFSIAAFAQDNTSGSAGTSGDTGTSGSSGSMGSSDTSSNSGYSSGAAGTSGMGTGASNLPQQPGTAATGTSQSSAGY